MTINIQQPKQNKMNRRQFLGLAWGGTLAVLGVELAATLARFVQPVSASGFGSQVRAGLVSDFAPGSVTQIKAGRFFLYRLDDGRFLALYQKCTHLGCSVPWVEAENQFHCPCHGSLYDKTGVVLGGPAPRPMDIFPVVVKNNEVWVDTSNPVQRDHFDPSQTTQV